MTPRTHLLSFDRRVVLGLFGLYVAIGLWLGSTAFLELRGSGYDISWTRPFVWELTGALSSFVLCFLPLFALRAVRWPAGNVTPLTVVRFLVPHALACVVYDVLHVSLMFGARMVIYPAAGWGPYDIHPLAYRLPMEWQKDTLSYLVTAVAIGAWQLALERRQVQLRTAALATELRQAQLAALSAQLQPHFLFNALNTVSALMYEDLPRTDRLIADLGQLLRAGLDAEASPCWSLASERDHTARYVEVMLARLGDRLEVSLEVESGALACPVPRFTLLRLVENSIKHNEDTAGRTLHVRAVARVDGDMTRLRVEDDGRGFAEGGSSSSKRGAGVGLANLRRSVTLLHGDRGRVESGEVVPHGAFVEVHMPRPDAS